MLANFLMMMFSLLKETYDMEDKTHPNTCYTSKYYCAYKVMVATYNPDMHTYWQASSGDEVEYCLKP